VLIAEPAACCLFRMRTAGTVSGGGVTDCYANRALRDANARCTSIVNGLRNRYDVAKPCTTCPEGNGESVWLIGQVSNYFDAGSCGILGCTGRSCSFSARYVIDSVQVTSKQATVYDAQLGVKLVTMPPRACYILMKCREHHLAYSAIGLQPRADVYLRPCRIMHLPDKM
jgi:hypothetical protein